ncbi:MAG: hypothetical protein ACJ79H_15145 [Myxococcales bacterium]
MTRKKGVRAFSKDELLQELARRHAEETYRDDMTMTDMELAVEQLKGDSGDQGIEAMLRRMKPEKPSTGSALLAGTCTTSSRSPRTCSGG